MNNREWPDGEPALEQNIAISKYNQFWSNTNFDMPFSRQSESGKGPNLTFKKRLGCSDAL